jgi:hypothetical protein
MKHLTTLLLTLLVLGGCSIEDDTRMVCDCDYVIDSDNREFCPFPNVLKNIPLVINSNKRKFKFDGIQFPDTDDTYTFHEDFISRKFDTETQLTYVYFDRVSLALTESRQYLEKYLDGIPIWKPMRTTYYNCRIVKGV